MADLIEELQWRGLLAQHTDLEALRESFAAGPVTFYCGYDPTAASLHHGHLVQLLLMRHLQLAGHRPITLVGGGTGLIGDPRMSGERTLNESQTVSEWAERLRAQISRFLDYEREGNPAVMVNNYEWIGRMGAIELLRDVGKYFRLGNMLAKDTVARRLASDEGISFTEFSYQLLQANDFRELYRRYGCTLQTGGNDQWGNLTAGTDLIRRSESASVHALTTPLITKADGTKFGKSEGGAVWLDPEMMSPYAFYQFWLNSDDADVVRFLKVFTFLSRERIEALEAEVAQRPFAREAQKVLASEVTTLVHGADAVERAQRASAALFGRDSLWELGAETLSQAVGQLPGGEGHTGMSMIDVLLAAGLEKGRSSARRTVANGGAYLNNEKIVDEDAIVAPSDVLPGGYLVVRKGKKNLAVLRVTAQGGVG